MSVLDQGVKLDGTQWSLRSSFENSGPYVFLISFACLYYVSNAATILGHYDLGWHLAAGDLIRARGEVPFQDLWSFTLGDRQWFNASWLWDVTASAIYQYAGVSGLLLFVVACGAIIAGYLTAIGLSSRASAVAVCIAVFAACLVYPSYATDPNCYLSAAPNMATMLFSVMFYGECLKRTRCLLLPPVMLLWVNSHGGFVLGFLIVAVFGATALLRRDWSGVKLYGLTGIGCFLAIFVNPLGWHIYDGVITTVGHFVQQQITEWLPYYHNLTWPGSIPAIACILIFIAFELRFPRHGRIPPEARLLSWLFLGLGIYQFRYMSFFFLFSSVVMAHHVDRLLPERMKSLEVRKSLIWAGVMGACALPLMFLRIEPTLGLSPMLSEQEAVYLQAHYSNARVLNHWNVGGLLIFYARGRVPVFVDGRAATAYPDDLLRDYFKLVQVDKNDVDAAAWDAVLEKYRIDAVLWVKAHDELRHFLVDERGWKEDASARYMTVYVRPSSASQAHR